MSKWLTPFLKKRPTFRPDKPDRFGEKVNMSVMSVPTQGHFSKNTGNMVHNITDKTDKFEKRVNMSVLSVPPLGRFFENAENNPHHLTDKPDRFEEEANMSVMSGPALDKNLILENFEERLAIAEIDGQQTPLQAHRIAYQDAFIAVLATLPWNDPMETGDWFEERIQKTREWLTAQNLEVPQ